MKTREQMIEAAEVYGRHNLVTLSREITEFLANFALEQIEEAIAAERERLLAFEWLEQNASEITAFVQNPDREIGIGWPVDISIHKYRGEITFHVSGELPGTTTSLLDAIQQATNQCVKGDDDDER